jgi:hypothetical protein
LKKGLLNTFSKFKEILSNASAPIDRRSMAGPSLNFPLRKADDQKRASSVN